MTNSYQQPKKRRRNKSMNKDIIRNRSEILFLYDVTDTNPNGDPDENRPRIDEHTGINEVTDVRLKRTIRDHLRNFRSKELFVRDRETEDGIGILDAKETAKKISKEAGILEKADRKVYKEKLSDYILNNFIDIRFFGATIPLEGLPGAQKGDSLTFTGPVQFNIGRSLHRVSEKHIKGTGGFASQAGKQQKTFRDDYVLPYSLICFYGIINENAAKITKLTEEDINLLLDGIWNGTKNLITRSKTGQVPRLLIKINYKEENFHIGGLRGSIRLNTQKEEEAIRSPEDYALDFSSLINAVERNKNKIGSINIIFDEKFKKLGDTLKKQLEEKEIVLNVLDPDKLP